MTVSDLEAAPLGSRVMTQDERVLVKTASGWVFADVKYSEIGSSEDAAALRPTLLRD